MNALNEVAGALCGINSPQRMRKFLAELFTPAELEDTALRWRLLKMLKAGRTQRDIASELNISLCKITRGSKILKDRNSEINQILGELK